MFQKFGNINQNFSICHKGVVNLWSYYSKIFVNPDDGEKYVKEKPTKDSPRS